MEASTVPGRLLSMLSLNVSLPAEPCTKDCLLNRRPDGSWALTQLPATDLDAAWQILCTTMIVIMQLGFAILEVGSCRAAHRNTVLAKNTLDSVVSGLAFWLHIKIMVPSIVRNSSGLLRYHLCSFHWTFCATSVTICSGSMAERAHMAAYVCYAVTMAAFIYPVIAEAVWGSQKSLLSREFHERWHEGVHYHDFAGSGVVHFAGGLCALAGNNLIGRRIVKASLSMNTTPANSPTRNYEENNSTSTPPGGQSTLGTMADVQFTESSPVIMPAGGWSRRFDSPERDAEEFRPCCYLQAMGMFTLWVGWYAFNVASTQAMRHPGSILAGRVVWNTTLAGCSGGVGSYVFCFLFRKKLDVSIMCNGVLSGLVSITASCDMATDNHAVGIGIFAGLILYPSCSFLLQSRRIDDPVDAIPVHLCSGLFGSLVVSVCVEDTRMIWRQLVAQVWGSIIVFFWTYSIATVLWITFAIVETIRTDEISFLEESDQLVCAMTTGAPQANANERWGQLIRGSIAARHVLARHGCTEQGFQEGSLRDLWRLRRDLQEKREQLESALEASICIHTCKRIFYPIRRVFHIVPVTRLRITPAAEMSGLGAADMDGGRLFRKLSKIIMALDTESKRKLREKESLEREVRELSMVVRSQSTLVEELMASGGAFQGGRRGQANNSRHHHWENGSASSLPSVSENAASDTMFLPQGGPIAQHNGHSSNVSSVSDHPSRSNGELPSFTQGRRSVNSGTASTVSEQRIMSPRSEFSTTPPPSGVELLSHRLFEAQRSQGRIQQTQIQQEDILREVAFQLARAMQSRGVMEGGSDRFSRGDLAPEASSSAPVPATVGASETSSGRTRPSGASTPRLQIL
eukprot:TRINITY_DN10433_c0_g1_i1.p1 TRINITY_DN10433_c0_g1~~TRINITY_DN10433_c0_g1_i1.p1  ORF type:complete len:882 (-),score=101.55 TRINITY_DN10433_c0_g1_i1:59-2632(-)